MRHLVCLISWATRAQIHKLSWHNYSSINLMFSLFRFTFNNLIITTYQYNF